MYNAFLKKKFSVTRDIYLYLRCGIKLLKSRKPPYGISHTTASFVEQSKITEMLIHYRTVSWHSFFVLF